MKKLTFEQSNIKKTKATPHTSKTSKQRPLKEKNDDEKGRDFKREFETNTTRPKDKGKSVKKHKRKHAKKPDTPTDSVGSEIHVKPEKDHYFGKAQYDFKAYEEYSPIYADKETPLTESTPKETPMTEDTTHLNPTVMASLQLERNFAVRGSNTSVESVSKTRLINLKTFELKWGNYGNYEILNMINKGSHSVIFKAIYVPKRRHLAAKILNDVPGSLKLKRELCILEKLRGGPGIIEYFDIIKMPITKQVVLITEFVYSRNVHHLSASELPGNLVYVFRALDYCHERGIMHRTLDPHHILVGHASNTKIIDWSSATFCSTKVEFSCDKGQLPYRAPEMMFDYRHYNCAVDMWSMGCILLELIFKRVPFLFASDVYSYIGNVCSVLGKGSLLKVLDKLKIKRTTFDSSIIEFTDKTKELKDFINDKNREYATSEAIDLASKLLVFDPESRISAAAAVSHAYFHSPCSTKTSPKAQTTHNTPNYQPLSKATQNKKRERAEVDKDLKELYHYFYPIEGPSGRKSVESMSVKHYGFERH